MTVAEHVEVWLTWIVDGMQETLTDVIVEAALTVIGAEPDLVPSSTEVAFTFAVVGLPGAAYLPD